MCSVHTLNLQWTTRQYTVSILCRCMKCAQINVVAAAYCKNNTRPHMEGHYAVVCQCSAIVFLACMHACNCNTAAGDVATTTL